MRRASSPSRPPPKPKPKLSPNKRAKAAAPAADDPPPVPAVSPAAPAAPPGPVKPEPPDDKIIMPPRPRPPAVVVPNPAEPWKHPDELEYVRPHSWSESTLISFLLDNAFNVPPRHPHGSADPWCVLTDRGGLSTFVPKGYRLPLMFAMKFQWESLRLVLSSPHREDEWKDYKFDILHVSRLCSIFIRDAREAIANNGMDKMWRSSMFDRALTRYYRRWLVNREEFLKAFWKEFAEEEYEEDILKKDWNRFVLKGHKGFRLTKEECAEGLSYQTLTAGLEQRSDGCFYWVLPPSPPASSLNPETAKRKKSRKMTGKRKRDGFKEIDKGEEGRKDKDKDAGDEEKEQEQEKEKAGMTGSVLRIHGWKGSQDSPGGKLKLSIVNRGEKDDTDSTPPAKKARIEEITEKEKVTAASRSSLEEITERERVTAASRLSLSDESESVEGRAIVKGKEKEGEKEVDQEKEKEKEEDIHQRIVICKSPTAHEMMVYLGRPPISDEGNDGGNEEEEKGEEEKGEEEGEEEGQEKEGQEKEGEEKEEKEKRPSEDYDDDDDRLLQEGLRYPEPQSGPIGLDSQVPHEIIDEEVDNENEKYQGEDEDEQKSIGASDIEPPAPALSDAIVATVTSDFSFAPATTSAVIYPIDSVSISDMATSTNASSSTLTTTSTANTNNTTTNIARPPTEVLTLLPASAPASSEPSHPTPTAPHAPLSNLTPHTNENAHSEARARPSEIVLAPSISAGPSTNAGIDRDPLPPTPSSSRSAVAAVLVTAGSSNDAAKEGGTSLEKRQSSWDLRVSKALEKARERAIKGSGSGTGTLAGAGGATWVPPRAAWYVPQISQWDTKEKERLLQRANPARATSVGSPVFSAAGLFPPASSSRPSTSDTSPGLGSGSGAFSVSENQPQMLSPAPSVVESVPALGLSLQPPVPTEPNNLTNLQTVTEKVSDDPETDTPLAEPKSDVTCPMDVDTASTSVPDPAPLTCEADAPWESPVPLSPAQTLDPQPLSRSPLRSVSPARTSNDNMESQAETPRPNPRRELPPLPGPSLPGRSATFEEYQLAAAAWSGSGSSDHGNDGDSCEREGMRGHIARDHEHERDVQHNRVGQYERAMYYDGHHSTTPGSPAYRRYHPYPYLPPGQPRYYPFAPPYYPSTPYNDAPYFPPSVSALYRPSRRSSVNGRSLSEMQSPVPPDIDPEGAEVDGSPVATRIVSIVQDTMLKLADVLSASGSAGESGMKEERRRQMSSVVSGSVSSSTGAGILRSDHAQRERVESGESLKLEDILGEIRLLKEEHRCEVNKMRNEIQGLRRQVQDLEGRRSREQRTDEQIPGAANTATEANGVVFVESSLYPVGLIGHARDSSLQMDRPVSLQGTLHRLETPTTVNTGDDNSPSSALRQNVAQADKGKGKEKEVCRPRMGPTSSNEDDRMSMSPSHNGLPLPIKSQRKGRMFVPVDMTDDSQETFA